VQLDAKVERRIRFSKDANFWTTRNRTRGQEKFCEGFFEQLRLRPATDLVKVMTGFLENLGRCL